MCAKNEENKLSMNKNICLCFDSFDFPFALNFEFNFFQLVQIIVNVSKETTTANVNKCKLNIQVEKVSWLEFQDKMIIYMNYHGMNGVSIFIMGPNTLYTSAHSFCYDIVK